MFGDCMEHLEAPIGHGLLSPHVGKLAERYADAARSGVYRVTRADVPIRAASEANARLFEFGIDAVRTLSALRRLIAQAERPCVVLIDAQDVALRDGLVELAAECREKALPFFALFVDPTGALDLPDLYKER